MSSVEILGAWLLTYFVHSTLLIGTALTACYLMDKRPRMQDTLLKLALVGGLITATVQVGLGVAPLAGNVSVAAAPSVGVQPSHTSDASATTAAKPVATAPVTSTANPRVEIVARPRPGAPATTHAPASAPIALAAEATESASTAPSGGSWIALVVIAWLAGVAVFAGLLLVSWVRLRRRLSGRRELADGPLRYMLDNLLRDAEIRRRVRLTACADLEVPIAIGVFRREICVPERALTELSHEHHQSLLAHETAHLVRYDPQWRLFGSVVQGALFIQPLNRLVNRRLHAASEHLCDDWAITFTDRPLALAKCLTVVARWIANPGHTHPVPAMASHRSGLGRRVRRLVEREPGANNALPRWSLAAFAAALALIVIAAPGASSASDGISAGDDDDAVELADVEVPTEGEATEAPPSRTNAAPQDRHGPPVAAHPAGAYPDDLEDAVKAYAYSWSSDVEDDIRDALAAHGIDLDDVLSPEDLAQLEELAKELEGTFGPGGSFDLDDFDLSGLDFGDFDMKDFDMNDLDMNDLDMNDFDIDMSDFDLEDFDMSDFDLEDLQNLNPFDDVVIFDGALSDLEHLLDGDFDIKDLEKLFDGAMDADIDVDIDIRIDGKPLEEYIDIYVDTLSKQLDGKIKIGKAKQKGAEAKRGAEKLKKRAAQAKKLAKKYAAKAKQRAKKHAAKAKKLAEKAEQLGKKRASRGDQAERERDRESAEREVERAKREVERAKREVERDRERALREVERARREVERAKQRDQQRHSEPAQPDGLLEL